MDEAREQNLRAYESFNDFFTRALKPEARPIATDINALISPADGAVSQCGSMTQGRLIQAKGHTYLVTDLVGDAVLSAQFENGTFITTYLSPKDYHRVHMPVAGTLIQSRYIPGKLFSVNEVTARRIPGLFARNERLVCWFESDHGRFALIMVGAMMVAGIETVWQGTYSPRNANQYNYGGKLDERSKIEPPQFAKGEEIGRFKFGSTVILLLPDQVQLAAAIEPGSKVQVGEVVAMLPGQGPVKTVSSSPGQE